MVQKSYISNLDDLINRIHSLNIKGLWHRVAKALENQSLWHKRTYLGVPFYSNIGIKEIIEVFHSFQILG